MSFCCESVCVSTNITKFSTNVQYYNALHSYDRKGLVPFLFRWPCENNITAHLQILPDVFRQNTLMKYNTFAMQASPVVNHYADGAAERSGTIPNPVCPRLGLHSCKLLLDLTLHGALCVQHHKQMCCLYRLLGLCIEMVTTAHRAKGHFNNLPK